MRLSNGRVVKAYIPGMGGHNLQAPLKPSLLDDSEVHSVVRVRGGRRRELIGPACLYMKKIRVRGVNYTCMRGQYDLLPVKNRKPVAYFL